MGTKSGSLKCPAGGIAVFDIYVLDSFFNPEVSACPLLAL